MFSLGYEKANLDDDDEDFFLYGPNMAHDARLAGLRSQVNDVTRYQINRNYPRLTLERPGSLST